MTPRALRGASSMASCLSPTRKSGRQQTKKIRGWGGSRHREGFSAPAECSSHAGSDRSRRSLEMQIACSFLLPLRAVGVNAQSRFFRLLVLLVCALRHSFHQDACFWSLSRPFERGEDLRCGHRGVPCALPTNSFRGGYQAVLWTGCEHGVVICGQRRFLTLLLCRLWTPGESVCVTVQCCGQTASRESRSWTSCLHSHTLFRLHTSSFSKKRLWTGCSRGEALTSAGGQLPTESDSLAQGRTQTRDTRLQCDRLGSQMKKRPR